MLEINGINAVCNKHLIQQSDFQKCLDDRNRLFENLTL